MKSNSNSYSFAWTYFDPLKPRVHKN